MLHHKRDSKRLLGRMLASLDRIQRYKTSTGPSEGEGVAKLIVESSQTAARVTLQRIDDAELAVQAVGTDR